MIFKSEDEIFWHLMFEIMSHHEEIAEELK